VIQRTGAAPGLSLEELSLRQQITYPEVLKTIARFVDGTPKVQTSDVVTSTLHKIAVPAAA